MVRKRFSEQLRDTRLFARWHFKDHWGIDTDLYEQSIDANIAYLDHILTHHRRDYAKHLRQRKTKEP